MTPDPVKQVQRCGWVPLDDLIYMEYHDREWGVPVHEDTRLFEFLILEGVQAGLSWKTVLKKRNHYREVYHQFNPEKVALYDSNKMEELMQDTGIVRNRLKVESSVQNAISFVKVQEEFGSFNSYIWNFVGGKPIKSHWKKTTEIPSSTRISDLMSKDLRRRGFRFVGSTICYAFMQAVGLVNDHVTSCFRYSEING